MTPSSATIPNVGGTSQFQATGYFVNGKNGNSNNQNLTSQVTWTSSTPTVATINSSGLATAVGVGTTTITATGGNGGLTSTADLTVSNGANGNTLQSIDVVPASQTVNQIGET
ncbi:MAG: Ig-like domain-containing protein, partial [Candidatus Korobacteraceae bacterium]